MLESLKKSGAAVYNRLASKKLMAFMFATALLWFGKIGENVWEMITIIFISAQAAYDTAITWKHGIRPTTTDDSEPQTKAVKKDKK